MKKITIFLAISLVTNLIGAFMLGSAYMQIKEFEKIKPDMKAISVQDERVRYIQLINHERENAGLKPLVENTKLDTSAQEKACDMSNRGYWDHFSPDGVTPWDFFRKVQYTYYHAGENLARDFYIPEKTVSAWMSSKDHRDNILFPDYQDTGIGICGIYVVEHFGVLQK